MPPPRDVRYRCVSIRQCIEYTDVSKGAAGDGGRGASFRAPEATRQRILDAVRLVFAERLFGASIEDICEQAGFTGGAVYSNFASKDDILREVIEREHQALLDHIAGSIDIVDEELAAAPSLEAAVASLVNRIVRTIPPEER